MAKSKKHSGNGTGDSAPVETQDGTLRLTIQGIPCTISAPYVEGHTINDAEAKTLNQTRAENIRNNFAKTFKAAKEAAAKAGVDVDVADLTAKLSAYESTYEFSGKRQSRAPVDPVERIASGLAREALKAAMRAKNIDIKSLAEGKMEELITQLLDRDPKFREEAKARHSSAQAAAATALEGLDLGGATA